MKTIQIGNEVIELSDADYEQWLEEEEMRKDGIPEDCILTGCPGPWCWECRKGCENMPNSVE